MASITFDGQSFLVDGRRLWLVGGTIHYSRLTRDQWAGRIAAAKLAGLNTVTTAVVWARHEPRPGQFDFTGDNDLRHFVQLVHQAGMHCIIRLGPFVGSGFDFGGLPPWVLSLKDVKVRTANQPFLEATSRFFGAVAKQVRDLQVTNPQFPGDTHGGPIVLVQSEQEWTCGHDHLAQGYLGELNRYIHESGFEVPVVNANNLWEGVEGEVDGWVGNTDLAAMVRQLSSVRPNQPRLVVQYRTQDQGAWGEEPTGLIDGERLQRDLMSVLACAGQFNIEPFCAGTNFAFSGGRLPGGPERFALTINDDHAPLGVAGDRGDLFEPLRRVATFASRFGRVLSHLDARHPAVCLHPQAPTTPARKGQPDVGSHSVVHASGPQGAVAFVFAGKNAGDRPANLLLGDGTTLPVHLGNLPVACCLIGVRLHGRSQLDYCNLSALACVGRTFVAYGPAGSPVRLSINGSPLEMDVPTGDNPAVVEHENIQCVICSPEQLERVWITDEGVLINAVGATAAGNPLVRSEKDVVTRVTSTGEVVRSRVGDKPPAAPAPAVVVAPKPDPKAKKAKPPVKGKKGAEPPAPPPPPPPPVRAPVLVAPPARAGSAKAPELALWTSADTADYTAGGSARFASVNGPSELATLGAPYGYGWYKLTLRPGASGRTDVTVPGGGDRLAFFVDGKPAGVLGRGPGAEPHVTLPLRRAEQTIVVLAENLGRFCGGSHLVDHKGVVSHLHEVRSFKLGRPVLQRAGDSGEGGGGINVLGAFPQTPLLGVHQSDVTEPVRITWHITKRKSPLLLRLGHAARDVRGVLVVNDTPVRFVDQTGPGEVLIDADRLQRATNTLQLALLGADPAAVIKPLTDAVTAVELVDCISEKASWSFAKWERPADGLFRPLRGHSHGKGPEWFRSTFSGGAGGTLALATTGLSKGQVYVNGRHVGRYFTSTAHGKPVGPQTDVIIPPSALRTEGLNELVIFDEHGHLPSKTRLFWKG